MEEPAAGSPPVGEVARTRHGLARLARYGFTVPERAAQLLAGDGLGLWEAGSPVDEPAGALVAALTDTADPDRAVLALHRLACAQPDAADRPAGTALLGALRADRWLAARLLAVLGASDALADHLVAYPGDWRVLADRPAGDSDAASRTAAPGGAEASERAAAEPVSASRAEGADGAVPPVAEPDEPDRIEGSGGGGPGGPRGAAALRAATAGTGAAAVAALRQAYRRELLRVAADDLTGARDVEQVMAELTELADAVLAAALALAEREQPAGPAVRLAVLAMGKCGGSELNYVSDVDVLFVVAPAGPGDRPEQPADTAPADTVRAGTVLARRLIEVCRQVAWQVDAGLRPEGRDGPLVRTVPSYRAYYQRWAKTWEFQALLKARPAAGDRALAEEFLAVVGPLVWQADGAARPSMVDEVRAMRRRVEDTLPAGDAEREIKLGRGGLRDIEFAVQLLQLVHGRSDEELRSPTTLAALRALTAGGYVGRADGEELEHGYRFLRTVEHRLQLQALRRTHRIPDDEAGLRWLAQALGYRAESRRGVVEQFLRDWSRLAAGVRRLHEKLLYRPLLEAVARVPTEALRLTSRAAESRLAALGFADPPGALRHIAALTGGVSRTAAIQRTLLPALLPVFADAPEPDRGLLAYRQVSDQLGRTPWYLRLLRDSGPVAIRLATLLGESRYVTDLLARDPEALRLLATDAELAPRSAAALAEAMDAAVRRYDRPADAVAALRALRRRELFRIACADLLGMLDITEVGVALSDVTDATLSAALAVARADAGAPDRLRFTIIGMGRLGGREVGYASDADVLFVHNGTDSADSMAATAIAERLRALLSAPAPDPPLAVDAGLRPEGREGPLARSLAAYRSYYRRWARVWEAQALLRARRVAGDPALGAEFLALADPVRYPLRGLSHEQLVEIRRIKARVDAERLPRGADPATHTKLGRGGLADVEWTVQVLQLDHAGRVPALRTTGTLDALAAAVGAGLLTADEVAALRAAWRLASQVRNAMMLVRGRGSDQLPRRGAELAGVVAALHRPLGRGSPRRPDRARRPRPGDDPGQFVDDYLRTARRARQVVVAHIAPGTG